MITTFFYFSFPLSFPQLFTINLGDYEARNRGDAQRGRRR